MTVSIQAHKDSQELASKTIAQIWKKDIILFNNIMFPLLKNLHCSTVFRCAVSDWHRSITVHLIRFEEDLKSHRITVSQTIVPAWRWSKQQRWQIPQSKPLLCTSVQYWHTYRRGGTLTWKTAKKNILQLKASESSERLFFLFLTEITELLTEESKRFISWEMIVTLLKFQWKSLSQELKQKLSRLSAIIFQGRITEYKYITQTYRLSFDLCVVLCFCLTLSSEFNFILFASLYLTG